MIKNSISEIEFQHLEFCWSISEETEDLADYSKDHIDTCWENICGLTNSDDSDVRWQVYSVLGSAGAKAEQILREGLQGIDPYCKRRAILSLAKLRPKDAEELGKRFINDPDPYIRQASVEMFLLLNERGLRKKAKKILNEDNAKHVVKAVKSFNSTRLFLV